MTLVNLKKKLHNVRVVSSVLFGGKMRTAALRIVLQRAPRNCDRRCRVRGAKFCNKRQVV